MDETIVPAVVEGFLNIQEDHDRVVGKRLVPDDVFHLERLVDGRVSFPEAKLFHDDDLMLVDVRYPTLENEPLEEFADCRQQRYGSVARGGSWVLAGF